MWRTTAVTISTCFLLGTTFTHWIADHNVLWRSPLTADALDQSITYYSLLSSAPAGLGWVYVAVGIIAIASTGGRIVKGFSGENGEVLFDGGSLILLSAIAYNQISEVYPTISLFPSPLPLKIRDHPLYPGLGTAVRDLANDNVITAVMLTGVMLLQAGRYYSNRTSPTRPTADSAPSSPPNELASQAASASLRKRVGTPYRELTEEEAMELSSLGGSVASNSKHQKR